MPTAYPPFYVKKRRWLSNAAPWAAFMPKRVQYPNVSIFQRLFEDTEVLFEDKVDGGWRLCDRTIQRWKWLENCLISVKTRLYGGASDNWAWDFEWPLLPESYGYRRTHRTALIAEACMSRSREAFLNLLVACSFSIACNFKMASIRNIVETYAIMPQWMLHLVKTQEEFNEVVEAYVDELGATWIADFVGVERVGCFIDVSQGTDHIHPVYVQAAISSGIPVWIYWGTNKKHPQRSNLNLMLQRLMPSTEAVNESKEKAAEGKTAEGSGAVETRVAAPVFPDKRPHWEQLEPFRYHTHAELETRKAAEEIYGVLALAPWRAPMVDDNQLRFAPCREEIIMERRRVAAPIHDDNQVESGEDWRAFFTRQAQLQERRRQNEDVRKLQARLSRERQAASQSVPGKRGAQVFKWDKVDSGGRVRTRIDRGEVDHLWVTYARTQRKYNSFDNEWDLCSEFDPEGVAEADEEVDEDPTPDVFRENQETDAWEMKGQNNMTKESIFAEDLRELYMSSASSGHTPIDFPSEDLATLLRRRYGYFHSNDGEGRPEWLKELPLWMARKILLEEKSREEADRGKRIALFVAYLCYRETDSNEAKVIVPSTFWDLDPCNSRYLGDNQRRDIRITRRAFCREVMVEEQLMDLDVHLWCIEDNTHTESWVLGVEHASSAVQVLRNRSWGCTRWELAKQLLERGIPFSTLGATARTVLNAKSKTKSLGWRPQNFIPDRGIDYPAYVARRDNFLAGPRGRVAMMRGGILWRLARDVVKTSTVVVGPNRPEYEAPKFVLRAEDGGYLYDDDLTEEETDLICGVYRVHTGEHKILESMNDASL